MRPPEKLESSNSNCLILPSLNAIRSKKSQISKISRSKSHKYSLTEAVADQSPTNNLSPYEAWRIKREESILKVPKILGSSSGMSLFGGSTISGGLSSLNMDADISVIAMNHLSPYTHRKRMQHGLPNKTQSTHSNNFFKSSKLSINKTNTVHDVRFNYGTIEKMTSLDQSMRLLNVDSSQADQGILQEERNLFKLAQISERTNSRASQITSSHFSSKFSTLKKDHEDMMLMEKELVIEDYDLDFLNEVKQALSDAKSDNYIYVGEKNVKVTAENLPKYLYSVVFKIYEWVEPGKSEKQVLEFVEKVRGKSSLTGNFMHEIMVDQMTSDYLGYLLMQKESDEEKEGCKSPKSLTRAFRNKNGAGKEVKLSTLGPANFTQSAPGTPVFGLKRKLTATRANI